MERLVEAFNCNGNVKQEQNRKMTDTLTITQEQASRFESITRYLFDRGTLSKAESFLGYDPILKFETKNGYGISDSIIKKMGIIVQETPYSATLYLNYYAEQKDAVSVKGYDVMKDVYLSSGQRNPIEIYDGFALSYDSANQNFYIEKEGQSQIEIPLTTLTKN